MTSFSNGANNAFIIFLAIHHKQHTRFQHEHPDEQKLNCPRRNPTVFICPRIAAAALSSKVVAAPRMPPPTPAKIVKTKTIQSGAIQTPTLAQADSILMMKKLTELSNENAKLKQKEEIMQQEMSNMKILIQAQQQKARKSDIQKLQMQQQISNLQYDLQIQTLQNAPLAGFDCFQKPMLTPPNLEKCPVFEFSEAKKSNQPLLSIPLPALYQRHLVNVQFPCTTYAPTPSTRALKLSCPRVC